MSKAAMQALQTLGEEHLINQACLSEYQKGVSQAALMQKYGIGEISYTRQSMEKYGLEVLNTKPSRKKKSK